MPHSSSALNKINLVGAGDHLSLVELQDYIRRLERLKISSRRSITAKTARIIELEYKNEQYVVSMSVDQSLLHVCSNIQRLERARTGFRLELALKNQCINQLREEIER
jgi:hypothetical protein